MHVALPRLVKVADLIVVAPSLRLSLLLAVLRWPTRLPARPERNG
jgi:hypothetical protein